MKYVNNTILYCAMFLNNWQQERIADIETQKSFLADLKQRKIDVSNGDCMTVHL